MQVSKQPDGKMQFKSLDVNIRKEELNGQTNYISARCEDADDFCCNSLGVSRSILNHVLFCHQENSYWPLDQPEKVEEQFDEIFETVKYNKYIDFVRQDIKNKQLELKVLEQKVETKRIINEEVEKCRAKFEASKQSSMKYRTKYKKRAMRYNRLKTG
ncbi:unnamed protein product [Acanthoscelides obtectus]|uniref:Uncharacterized protein n=1 Tax=Acanthoscelides obtectus TaxID=200917 RepID=A0A9P0QBH0_ACAOB|nr:unnamed protein product [Acanthoscelides obtectus]CAK1687492.1 DNA repair protein RAD50 [Acanthoscelides obtectus]